MDGPNEEFNENIEGDSQGNDPQQQQQGGRPQQKRQNQFQGLIDAYDAELQCVDESSCPNIVMLVRNELFRLRGGVIDTIDVLSTKKTKVRTKVDIPVEAYPNVNFVGKLLGPGGQSLKAVQEQTNTKMCILGAGSLRNPQKEQELLNSGDPKYTHLRDRLHLQVESVGNAAEAYYNISCALHEIKKMMGPELGMENPMYGGQMQQVNPLMGGGGYGGNVGRQQGMRGKRNNRGNRIGGRGSSQQQTNGGNRNSGGFNQIYMNGPADSGFADTYAPVGFENYGGIDNQRGGAKVRRMNNMSRGTSYSRPPM